MATMNTKPAKLNPMVKLGLELGPIVLFFAGFRFVKDKTYHILGTDYSGFILMTAVFVLLIIATTVAFWRRRAVAGMLLLPYLAWVSFASVLAYALWQRNPTLLG